MSCCGGNALLPWFLFLFFGFFFYPDHRTFSCSLEPRCNLPAHPRAQLLLSCRSDQTRRSDWFESVPFAVFRNIVTESFSVPCCSLRRSVAHTPRASRCCRSTIGCCEPGSVTMQQSTANGIQTRVLYGRIASWVLDRNPSGEKPVEGQLFLLICGGVGVLTLYTGYARLGRQGATPP